jgi:hypothetical protein
MTTAQFHSDARAFATGALIFLAVALTWRLTRRRPAVNLFMTAPPGRGGGGGLGWKGGLAVIGTGVALFGWWWDKHHPAGSRPAAAPAPAVRPSPRATVTQTVTHQVVQVVHAGGMSGTEEFLLGLAAIAALVAAVRFVGRYFGT